MMVIAEHGDPTPPDSSPRAIRPHRTPHDLREQLLKAAGRFAWRWQMQRAVLMVAWMIVVGITLLAVTGRIALVSVPALDGAMLLVAWFTLATLSVLHSGATDGLLDRILAHRLCLHCGRSLLKEPVDEDEAGRCPNCRHRFTLAAYASPTACIEALRAARLHLTDRLYGQSLPDASLDQLKTEHRRAVFLRRTEQWVASGRVPEHRPRAAVSASWSMYESPAHFERVMNRAAHRIDPHARFRMTVAFALAGAALPAVAWLVIAPILPVMWGTALGLGLIVLVPAYAYGVATVFPPRVIRWRILDHQLCLRCGHALRGLPIEPGGVGVCPRCGRRYHVREYRTPPLGEINEAWREVRTQLLTPRVENEVDETPRIKGVDVPYVPPPKPAAPTPVMPTCPGCQFPLTGLSVDAEGEGACPECGTPFWRVNDRISTSNTSLMALNKVRERQRELRGKNDGGEPDS